MFGRRMLFGALLAAAAVCGQAKASQMEVTGDVRLGDGYTIIEAGFAYFLRPLEDSAHPYDLQPFMQKTPFVQAVYAITNSDFFDMTALDLNARLFMPDPVQNLYLQPHIVFADSDFGSANGWSLDVGYYFLDNLAVSLPGIAFGSFESGDDFLEIELDTVQARYVHPLGEQNLDALVSYGVDSEVLTLGALYYLDKSLGFGGYLTIYDGGTAITAAASYWMNAGFGANARFTIDDGDTELGVGVVARF